MTSDALEDLHLLATEMLKWKSNFFFFLLYLYFNYCIHLQWYYVEVCIPLTKLDRDKVPQAFQADKTVTLKKFSNSFFQCQREVDKLGSKFRSLCLPVLSLNYQSTPLSHYIKRERFTGMLKKKLSQNQQKYNNAGKKQPITRCYFDDIYKQQLFKGIWHAALNLTWEKNSMILSDT